ncbi:MAG: redoxin family protein [Gammaproteobacteria bacterium]|nr:redoxin family protein [Gammaproteobacteria bacterium]NIO26629.1 redoxin family protein [Gammaproteobacteria bacterium]NIO67182.1 redoxin family protein [Gammaproteobacteria bacterium]NIP47234.1 TlpA family protein disulfide reductase [Gammaproteobacteria bacterium]NIP66336.1 redoxin family protein [Gammaproteobacteria bacterium]
MKPIVLVSLVFAAGATALAAGVYVRDRLDPPAPELITVKQTQTDRSQRGQRPAFWLPDLQGVRRSISEWDGKLVVLNFWATWCPPCLHEIPMFTALQTRYGERGVQFLGVAIDDAEQVSAFAERVGLNYPTLHGQLDAIEVMSAYGNEAGGLPFTVVIDRQGNVVARHAGVLEEDTATALIEELL